MTKSDIKYFWGQRVDIVGDLWTTKVDKPIYGNCVALNGKLLDAAVRAKAKLKIITPKAEEIVDPAEWKRKARKFSKVFLYPESPMTMYQKTVGEHSKPEKQAELVQERLI